MDDNEACSPPPTLLIVTGSTLRAEEADRPLGYCLREHAIASMGPATAAVLVISDFRFLHDKALSNSPVISVGGPGVNALAHKWLEILPFVLIVEDEFFVQLDEKWPARASIWGMDHRTTRLAVSTFAERHLAGFLSACCSHNDGA